MNPIVFAPLLFAPQVAPADTLLVSIDSTPRALLVEEDLRIGSLGGAPETTFGYIGSIVEADDGTVFISDGMASIVRAFDSSGRYLRDIGRQGEGPGEYRGVNDLALTPSGGLAVWDFNGKRLSVFTGDGVFQRSFPVAMTAMMGGPGAGLVVDTAGRFIIRTAAQAQALGDGPQEAIYAFMRFTADGEFVDSLIPPRRNVGGSMTAFRYETASALSPHGYFVTGRNEVYRLTRPLSDGRAVAMERPVIRVPLEGEEREQWTAMHAEQARRMSTEFPDLPRQKPAWKGLSIDADGRIWVQVYQPAVKVPGLVTNQAQSFGWPNVNWVEPAVFDVLDARGTLIGTATLPPNSEFMFARGQSVWVRLRGEFDEHYAVRLRFRPAEGGR